MEMTPVQTLRNLFAASCKMDPYFMCQFDRWANTHIKQLNCTYTVYDPPGPEQAYIEETIKRKIANDAFSMVKRETSSCWGRPPHKETTMSIQIIV